MTRGHLPRPVPNRSLLAQAMAALCKSGVLVRSSRKAGIAVVRAVVLIFCLAATSLPMMADGTNAPPAQPAAGGENFAQYLAGHQEDLAPFFEKNAAVLIRLGVPVLMGMAGWIVIFTMLLGWVIDVFMGRGYAAIFAPAFTGLKRAVIYATGRLALSFVCTCLMGLAIVSSLKLSHAGIVVMLVVIVLLAAAVAAQVAWILYLYRTNLPVSVIFYIALVVAHAIVGVLIASPVISWQASSAVANFVDREITPRLQAEAESTTQELSAAQTALDSAKAGVADLQSRIAQAQADQEQVRKQIEEKKNSDIYVFGQIVQARARGEMNAARDGFTDFTAKFPSSPLNASARAQLTEINNQLAVQEAQKKQEDADAARAAAEARADLLARAGKGEVTLSEMRQVLLGKTRPQVSNLLGQPSGTASDSWSYNQRMIVNPVTNEKFGLMVYFNQGAVQGVDYNRSGASQ